jgi:hypothetical protein
MSEQRYVLVMVPADRIEEVPRAGEDGRRDAVIKGPSGEQVAGFFRIVGDVDPDWTVRVSRAMYERILVAEAERD